MKKVRIPPKMQKFYGDGTMLHPDREMVEDLLLRVPYGKVITIDAICQKMAYDHKTNVTCPMRTGNFVKTIIKDSTITGGVVPFWRVIRKNHLLINTPSTEICVENLMKEGFELSQNNKGEFKILNTESRLFSFL